ncbi:MAG: saccharopine dehydrogenase NADP-binding domain-containing protein [Fimbriimonadaceae bacterium]|nr:saccharopine dehydrogenase NADP-binding domain-containing protein [Fimbriimonadaceae bacterium]
MRNRVVVLGGYGRAGRLVSRYLADEPDVEVVVVGRNDSMAQAVAIDLSRGGRRVTSGCVDAGEEGSVRRAIKGARLLVVASSTLRVVGTPMDACLAEGVDYFDLQIESHRKEAAREERRAAIEAQGLCFVTDGGFHPGLPAVLVRHAATVFDDLVQADVGSFLRVDWQGLGTSEGTATEFAEELLDMRMEAFRDGVWRRLSFLEWPIFAPRAPFKGFRGVPMRLAELVELCDSFRPLQKTGFFIGGSGWVADWLMFPLAYGLAKAGLVGAAGRWLRFGLTASARPPFRCELLMDAVGTIRGESSTCKYRIACEDAYALTAASAAGCVLQMLRQPKAGLWRQGSFADPERLFASMRQRGILVEAPSPRS